MSKEKCDIVYFMWLGLFAIFLSGAIGGAINSVAVKLGVREIPPMIFTTFRFFFSTLCFLPIYFTQSHTRLFKKDVFTLVTMSLFFAINITVFSIGVQFTSAIMSQTLYILSPILVVTLAHFLIGEKYTMQKGLGLFISLSGVVFFIYKSASEHSGLTFGTPIGNVLILIGVLSYSLYLVSSRRLAHAYSPYVITLFNFLLTTVIVALCIPIELYFRPFHISHVNYIGIFSLVALVFSSISGYLLLQIGIKKTSAFAGSFQLYISPFFTSIAAIIFLGEKITLSFIVGAIIVAIGVLYATSYIPIKNQLLKMFAS